MPSTAIIWGVIAKIANKMADMSPLINSLYFMPRKITVTFQLLHKKPFPGGSIGNQTADRRVAGSSPTRGGKLVADARDQQPFEPREWGLESCSLRAFLREPPCRTCKKHQAGI